MSTGKTGTTSVFAKTVACSVMRIAGVCVVFALIFVQCPALTAQSLPAVDRVDLRHGWKLQSSCAAEVSGERVSSADFKNLGGWIDAEVPSTVLGAQIAAGQFPDALAAMNLRKIPGTDYPIGKIFTNLPMSETSPYHCSWWYRTEFSAPFAKTKTTWLHFDGINYRANIWINGRQLAKSDDVVGAYRSYDFDISGYIVEGKRNALAVEVFAQGENDLGINFVDWNPAPADKSLGLWRGVSLLESRPITVRSPEVITHFPSEDLSIANLTVVADVSNSADHAIKGVVAGTIGSIRFRQAVELEAHSTTVVRFTPEQFPQLQV